MKIVRYLDRKGELGFGQLKEEEVFREKQAARNAMIDAQARRLAEMQDNEEFRSDRARR